MRLDWHLVIKKGSTTGPVSDKIDLNVVKVIEYSFMNGIHLGILDVWFDKVMCKSSNCIVNIKQHNFPVAQVHNLNKKLGKFL